MLRFCVAYLLTLSIIFGSFISLAVSTIYIFNWDLETAKYLCGQFLQIYSLLGTRYSVWTNYLWISEACLCVASALLLALTEVDNDTSQQNVSLKWNHTETNHVAQPGKQKPYTWTSVHAAGHPRHQAGVSRYRVEFYPWTVLLASAGINRLWVFINTGVKTKNKHTSTLIRI